MYKILFSIGSFQVHSYYVLWASALSLAVVWIRKRAVGLYGLNDEFVRKCLIYGFLGMLLGARIGGYLDNWGYYSAHPEMILNLRKGGLSSTTAFLGAGIMGILYCFKHKIPIWRIADAASLPAAATVVIGRIGCFLNGCCYGTVSDSFLAVHFPFDRIGITRHPTQLYYSFGALCILLILYLIEKKVFQPFQRKIEGAILWPLFMILYGSLRFFVDFLRVGDRIYGLRTGQIVGFAVILGGMAWLSYTFRILQYMHIRRRKY